MMFDGNRIPFIKKIVSCVVQSLYLASGYFKMSYRTVLNASKKELTGKHTFHYLLLINLCLEQYCLVFWNNEDAVTVVPAGSVKDAVVGETREVSMGNIVTVEK